MNRGYKVYFKEGRIAEKATLKNKGNILKYYTFLMVKLLSLMIAPIIPLVNLAQVRLTKMIKDEHDIEFTRTTKSSDCPKNYWTIFVSSCFKGLYILGTILLITLGTGILFLIGALITSFITTQSNMNADILLVLFPIPGVILLLVYLVTLPFRYVPNEYIIDSNNELDSSKVLYYSFNALKKTGKTTLFLSYLMEGLYHVAFIVTGVVLYVLLDLVFVIEIVLLITVLFACLYLYFIPKISIRFAVFRYCLYEDVVYDQLIANKKVSGIAIKDVTPTTKPTSKQLLNQIFSNDNSEEQQVAKMSALLNMKNLYPTVEKTQDEIEAEILATPVEEFDLSEESKTVETEVVEETKETAETEVVEETEGIVETEVVEETEEIVETEVVEETEEIVETEVVEETEEIVEAEVVEETEEIVETEVVEETEEIVETEVVEETEEIVETEIVEETEEIVETEVVEETEETVETEVVEETEEIVEAEVVEETEEIVEAEVVEETEEIVETEIVEETEEIVETEIVEETEEIVETEIVEETEEIVETEIVEETEEIVETEDTQIEEKLELFDSENVGE